MACTNPILNCRLHLFVVTMVTHIVTSSSEGVALLVVDVQRCFLDTDAPLHIAGGGRQIVMNINEIRMTLDLTLVVLVKDEHCSRHAAFTTQHPGKKNFDKIVLEYNEEGKLCTNVSAAAGMNGVDGCHQVAYRVNQTLWPDHCITGTPEVEFAAGLVVKEDDFIIKTGDNCQVDSHSAFWYNGGFLSTGLHDFLRKNDVTTVVVTGVAMEFNVYFTAIDAMSLGYTTYVVLDATARAYGSDDDTYQERRNMLQRKGVRLVSMETLQVILLTSNGAVSTNAMKWVPAATILLPLHIVCYQVYIHRSISWRLI